MIQTINCKCGATIAGCTEPECYEEVDWQKEIRRYVKNGYTIKLVEHEHFKFSKCTCVKQSSNNLETQLPLNF